MTDQISGLGQNALDFLDALKANNNRDWFAENKARFEDDVKVPALALADQITAGLAALTGERQKAKLFRIHRDLRFSKDKTPYNTHIHIAWSDAKAASAIRCGSGALIRGVLAWEWASLVCRFRDRAGLEAFRDFMASDKGAVIANLVNDLRNGGIRISHADGPD